MDIGAGYNWKKYTIDKDSEQGGREQRQSHRCVSSFCVNAVGDQAALGRIPTIKSVHA